jgi:hypothetical protein
MLANVVTRSRFVVIFQLFPEVVTGPRKVHWIGYCSPNLTRDRPESTREPYSEPEIVLRAARLPDG